MVEKFTLTQQHIDLVRNMYIHFDNQLYYGAPCVNIKRPYGNSDVLFDVYEIVHAHEFEYDPDDEYFDADIDPDGSLQKLHEETATALQIILCTGSFVPGKYEISRKYDSRSWVLVS